MSVALCVLYAAVLAVLSVYGVHRSYLVYMARRLRPRLAELKKGLPPLPESSLGLGGSLPYVTIQLPLYNESTVVHRLLDAIAKVEYPRDRLEIQVLDDSTDETTELARRQVAELQGTGIDIVLPAPRRSRRVQGRRARGRPQGRQGRAGRSFRRRLHSARRLPPCRPSALRGPQGRRWCRRAGGTSIAPTRS